MLMDSQPAARPLREESADTGVHVETITMHVTPQIRADDARAGKRMASMRADPFQNGRQAPLLRQYEIEAACRESLQVAVVQIFRKLQRMEIAVRN